MRRRQVCGRTPQPQGPDVVRVRFRGRVGSGLGLGDVLVQGLV